jgi:hypothetical protein
VTPRASVVIPCHNKPGTLPLTIDTVLRQTVTELEVLLLGDGVTDDVRAVIEKLVAGDPRVRFLDFPKGPHHGEKYRHDAVLAAESDSIFYLCDDDLLLPEHVADLLALLERANFVQSLNGFARPDGTFGTFAADLGTGTSLRMMVREDVRYNAVSITGTAHSRDFYLAAGAHWDTTPAGEWPDHAQWRRMMRHPAFRGATSRRMTAIQLPTSANGRDAWTEEERLAEVARWHEVVVSPGGQAVVDERLARAAISDLARLGPALAEATQKRQLLEAELDERRTEIDQFAATITDLGASLRDLEAENRRLVDRTSHLAAQSRRLRTRLRRARAARRRAHAEIDALRGSRSWRLTAPLRACGQVARWLSARRRRG